MGFFYRTPDDLKHVESTIMALAQEVAIRGKGYGTPGLIEDHYAPEVARLWDEMRAHLSSVGRTSDLAALRKHILKNATFMDNGPFNHVFRPLILDLCPV